MTGYIALFGSSSSSSGWISLMISDKIRHSKWGSTLSSSIYCSESPDTSQPIWLHFAWVIDDAKCSVVTRVCVFVRGRMPTLLHGPGCNLGEWSLIKIWGVVGMPPSCALLGGFAIGARVPLLWQHNANPSYKLASIPRYDDIVRMLGGVCECCWPVTGGWRVAFSKLHAVYGKWAWLAGRQLAVDGGAFSTLLRRPGLRASTDGVLDMAT